MVEIDDRVEGLVRTTLHAVVIRDITRLQQAIGAFSDNDTTLAGYRLAATVMLVVLHDQHGRPPTADEIARTASGIAERNGWAEITADDVVALVSAISQGQPVNQVLPIERAVLYVYVLAGDLLATLHRSDEQWWDYLDRVEAAVEAAS
jgi:hypothetical protein